MQGKSTVATGPDPVGTILEMILPPPTGRWPVGTTTFHVTDPERGSAPDGSDPPRAIVVHSWYPSARAKGAPAPYLRDPAAEAELRRINPGLAARILVEGITTHAVLDAPVATMPGRIPVLLFSHGYLALPSDYTALMEDLASHGYAVFSITHPYETAATEIGDGRVATGFDGEALNAVTRGVVAEWHDEDAVSVAVTGAPDAATAERALRDYLARTPNSAAALERWAADMMVVADQLPTRFANRLDLKRLGAFGHSMGGLASALFSARDARCRAAINLDGTPQYGDLIDRPGTHPFLMVYASRAGRIGVSDLIYGRSESAWRAVIAGTLHLNFGDFQYRTDSSPFAEWLGPITAERATLIVHRLVREWFDWQLSGRRSALFDGELLEGVSLAPIGRH